MSEYKSPLLVITNARRPDSPLGAHHDLFAQDGKIAELAPAGALEIPRDAAHYDAKGRLLLPSLIDAHTHLREPGFEYKEDIFSGLTAAAHGGFGDIMCMANTDPVNDNPAITRFMLEKAAAAFPHGPRLWPVGALTTGLRGEGLAPLGELASAGCIAFSNDGRPVQNAEIFRRGVEYAAMWGKLVIDHCEDLNLSKDGYMNEGETSGYLGLKGQSVLAESVQVARDVLTAEYLGLPVHLAHISCRQSIDLIRWAKGRNVPVTAETCPHYLLLDDSDVGNYDTLTKVAPPLRSRKDVEAVREALQDGTIDILATDHAPHASHEKDAPFADAPNGMTGLETALSLTYSLVKNGLINEKRLEEAWCLAPARIFGLAANRFNPGDRADFLLFDPEQEWLVEKNSLHSKSLNTPWIRRKLTGKVTALWLGGARIV